jgi:hypothetical protein
MWICGGVSVNDHTISDFRTQHNELLKRVLTDSIAVLHDQDTDGGELRRKAAQERAARCAVKVFWRF